MYIYVNINRISKEKKSIHFWKENEWLIFSLFATPKD